MKKTITEYGYTLENSKALISVTNETSFGKNRKQYYVENKETGKFWTPKTLKEAKGIASDFSMGE